MAPMRLTNLDDLGHATRISIWESIIPSIILVWDPSSSTWEIMFSDMTFALYSLELPSGKSTSYTTVFSIGLLS